MPDSTTLPQSIAQSTLHILGVDLVVHVLDNGQRIIEADGMHALFAAMETGATIDPDAAHRLAQLIHPSAQGLSQ